MSQSEIRALSGKAGVAPIEFGATSGRGLTVATGAVGTETLTEGWWEIAAHNAAASTKCALGMHTAALAHGTLLPAGDWTTSLTTEIVPFLTSEKLRFYVPAGLPALSVAHTDAGTVHFILRKVFTR